MTNDRTSTRGASTAAWTGLAGVGLVGGGLALWSALAARTATQLVPTDGRFIDVAGARLHYTDQGSGPPIVMIHGLMGQLRNFTHSLTGRLARDHRVICVDRPGWGHSTLTGSTRPGIVAQAGMIAELIGALGLERPLVVGHSLGGAVALAMAVHHPDRVGALALVAPLARPQDTPPSVFRPLTAPAALRGLTSWTLAVPAGTFTGPATAQAIFAPDPVPADFATRGGGALALRPQSYRAGAFELSIAHDEMAALAPRYAEIGVPVAILYGRDDAVLDAIYHGEEAAGQLPGATVELIAGGHMLPVTRPDETAAFVRSVAARMATR